MGLRVKNVEQGFVDGSGVFHPIRASSDYDGGRVSRPARKATSTKKRKLATKRKRVVKSRPAAKRAKKTKYQTTSYKKRVTRKAPAKRKRNPSPLQSVKAEFAAWVKRAPRMRSDVRDEINMISSNVVKLSPTAKAGLWKIWEKSVSRAGVEGPQSQSKNPLPVSRWVTAKVKRTASGDVKIMIPGRR